MCRRGRRREFFAIPRARLRRAMGGRTADSSCSMMPALRERAMRCSTAPARVSRARPDEVAAGSGADRRWRGAGRVDMAGYIAYEAGLALEPRSWQALAASRTGRGRAAGVVRPVRWLRRLPPAMCRLAGRQRAEAPARFGPLEPQLSPGGYARAFAALARGDPRGRHLSGEPDLSRSPELARRSAGALCRAASGGGAGYGGLVCSTARTGC
jgi:para-aminobenzoate synthetase / 4-amino-4-deoxychorismate lyase